MNPMSLRMSYYLIVANVKHKNHWNEPQIFFFISCIISSKANACEHFHNLKFVFQLFPAFGLAFKFIIECFYQKFIIFYP